MTTTTQTSTAKAPPAYLEALNRQVWITKGCRFNAARRLRLKHVWSSAAVGFLSVYVIGASIALLLPGLTENPGIWTVVTLTLSLAILVFSTLAASRSYELKSDRQHRCGLALNELYSKIKRTLYCGGDQAGVEQEQEYHAILGRFDENHEPVDYLLFCAQNPAPTDMKTGRVKQLWYCVRWGWASGGAEALAIVLPPVGLVVVLWLG